MAVSLGFDRDLDLPALRRLVGEIGADPSMWRELVNLDAEHRHYAQLWRDDHVDIWVISWMNGHDTGFHDHDLSSGAVAVVEGELVEERMALGGPPRRRAYGPARRSSSTPRTSTACTRRAAARLSRSTPTRPRCGAWART